MAADAGITSWLFSLVLGPARLHSSLAFAYVATPPPAFTGSGLDLAGGVPEEPASGIIA